MDDELEGIELRYLREKALKSMQKGSTATTTSATEPPEDADFGIDKLLSEARSVSKARKRKPSPETSAEVSSFINPVSSTQKCRSESASSHDSTDKCSSSVSSQDSSHSSRTGSSSYSSSRSSDSRSSYSSSRSSSVSSSSSSRHKSPQSRRRIASPSPRYRKKTSIVYHRHHRDRSPRRPSPRRPRRPPFNQSHSQSLRNTHYRHSIRSRSPVHIMHHSSRRHSPPRGRPVRHYDDQARHSYLSVHRNRSPLPSRSWQPHRSRRSPPKYINKEQHGRRDERHSYQQKPSQKRPSRHISSNDRSPDSKLQHDRKRLRRDSLSDQKKSLSSNVKKESPTPHLGRKRQLHDSDEAIDQDAKRVPREEEEDIDNNDQQPSISVGIDSLDEELDYDESMDSIDVHFFPEAGDKDEEPEQKSFQSKNTKESVSESSSKRRRDVSPKSASPVSLNDCSGALINSPIRLSPEPRKKIARRISPSGSSSSKLHVKERLFLTKSDIERKRRTASHRSEHRLSSKLASRLGPSPAARDSPTRQSSMHRMGHAKGSAMAIADEYRRQKLIRRDEHEKAKRITSYLNDHQSKDKSPVKKRKDNDNEESLDRRIKRIKQKNKEILQRSEEVEKDKHLYS